MDSFDFLLTVTIGIASLFAAWQISRFYYRRTYGDLQEIKSSLESQNLASVRLLTDGSSGELIKGSNGKWSIRWKRTIPNADIALGANVSYEIKRANETKKT